MIRATLRTAKGLVNGRRLFKGSNIFSEWLSDDDGSNQRYVVYSYGHHFPMYVYDSTTGRWYGNRTIYSPSTSRHKTACCPPEVHEWHPTPRMKAIAAYGMLPVVLRRLQGEAA